MELDLTAGLAQQAGKSWKGEPIAQICGRVDQVFGVGQQKGAPAVETVEGSRAGSYGDVVAISARGMVPVGLGDELEAVAVVHVGLLF